MIRRPRRTVAATLVALVVTAVCAVVATSCVQILLGQEPVLPFATFAEVGAGLTGGAAASVATSVVVAVLGLVLITVAVRPGNPTVVPVGDAGTGIETGLARRGLDRALADAATSVEGITRASARTRGRRTTVTAHAGFGTPADQRAAVRTAAESRLSDLNATRSRRIRVRITTDKEH